MPGPSASSGGLRSVAIRCRRVVGADGWSAESGEGAGIWRGIWYREAHHSTAIEGNTLVLKEVERLLAEGRAIRNGSSRWRSSRVWVVEYKATRDRRGRRADVG